MPWDFPELKGINSLGVITTLNLHAALLGAIRAAVTSTWCSGWLKRLRSQLMLFCFQNHLREQMVNKWENTLKPPAWGIPHCAESTECRVFSAIDPLSLSIFMTPITMVSHFLAGMRLKTEAGGGGNVPFLTLDDLEFCSSGNKLRAEHWLPPSPGHPKKAPTFRLQGLGQCVHFLS